jgi:squalene monooxygenase
MGYSVNVVEATVTELLESGERITGVKYKLKGSQQYTEVTAPLTIVCDGCFSKFRKTLVKNVPKTVSHFVAVIMKDMEMTYEQHGNVFLVEPSPTLMYRVRTIPLFILF